MIVKYLDNTEWHYVESLVEVSKMEIEVDKDNLFNSVLAQLPSGYDGEIRSAYSTDEDRTYHGTVLIRMGALDTTIAVVTNQSAFLMNSIGQTIERLN